MPEEILCNGPNYDRYTRQLEQLVANRRKSNKIWKIREDSGMSQEILL